MSSGTQRLRRNAEVYLFADMDAKLYNARLAAGSLSLVNVTVLVVDASLAVEEMIIGLDVPQHLSMETKTILNGSPDLPDGA